MEMKTDIARLPNELGKMKSVSKQLKVDEISTISKFAKGSSLAQPHSIITQGPGAGLPPDSGTLAPQQQPKDQMPASKKQRSDITVKSEFSAQRQPSAVAKPAGGSIVQTGQTLKLTPGSGLALQTPEGLIVYTVPPNTKPVQQSAVVQTAANSGQSTMTTTSQGQHTYTIGLPAAYVDSGLYLQGQTVQLLPVSAVSGGTQQVMYWPVQGAQTTKVSTVPPVSQVTAGPDVQSVLQPVQHTMAGGATQDGKASGGKAGGSIITID